MATTMDSVGMSTNKHALTTIEDMEVSTTGGTPIAGRLLRENPIKVNDLGVPLF